MNGQRFYSIDKDIVEVVVKELLIDSQEKLIGDISYTVAVKKKKAPCAPL